MFRSQKQEAASLTKSFDAIWRMGDKDECSCKHISFAISALAFGLKWTEAIDYRTPWGEDCSMIISKASLPKYFDSIWTNLPKKMNLLTKKWEKITAKRDLWGADEFWNICQLTSFASDWTFRQTAQEETL